MVTRKCLINGKSFPISELIRFVLKKDGTICLEKEEKIYGRGAYCLKDEKTIEIFFQKKMLSKSFKRNVSQEIYNTLWKEVHEYVKIKK